MSPNTHFTNPRDRHAQREAAQVLDRAERQEQRRVVRDITEADLQRHVIDQARSLGWGVTLAARKRMLEEAEAYRVDAPPLDGLIYHPRYSLGSEPGWPDLTLVRRRDRRLIFAELKSERGVLSVRQAEVLDLLRCLEASFRVPSMEVPGIAPRIEIHVWRPSDIGQIAEVLR